MILLSVLLVVLAVFGAPLFAVIAASAMLGYQKEGIDLMAIAIEILGIANMPFLSAIPLFTFAGYLLSESNAPKRLVRMTGALLGWMPGGLALVSLAACAFFTGELEEAARILGSAALPFGVLRDRRTPSSLSQFGQMTIDLLVQPFSLRNHNGVDVLKNLNAACATDRVSIVRRHGPHD